jgi:ankyrin repeat protein
MSKDTAHATAMQGPASEEPQAPPYVLHQHPFRSGPSADEIENLPLYTEHHDPNAPIDIRELNKILCIRDRTRENDVNIWRRYLDSFEQGKQTNEEREIAKAYIITHYFSAIRLGQEDVIALLIENHLVTANTKLGAMTPLLMAVSKKNVSVVKQLLELGADPNEFGGLVSRYTVV